MVKKTEFICQIKKSEIEYFKCPEKEENKIGESIINLSFKEDNQWFVNDGESSFYVKVEDTKFLQDIYDSLVEFRKDDILTVEIRREQFYCKDTKKLKTKQFIQEVKNHSNPSKQMDMFNK